MFIRRLKVPLGIIAVTTLFSLGSTVIAKDLSLISESSTPLREDCTEIANTGDFIETFLCGDELFETRFNALDGGGMNVGDGNRYSRVPRLDLKNWASTTPSRDTGPNAQACNNCHISETIGGAGNGGGTPVVNAVRDPLLTGKVSSFIHRNTPHLFGVAGLQLLAEEMTDSLAADVSSSVKACLDTNASDTRDLFTKGVNFGSVTSVPPCEGDNVVVNAVGVADDLIVRPFQWKGSETTLRNFSRDAFHNEMGMQPVETTGDGVDGDYDGVTDEISIGDVTAMAIYIAGQPRPTSLLELNELRQILSVEEGGVEFADLLSLPDLSDAEQLEIVDGEAHFKDVGCSDCHVPSLTSKNVVYSEPSTNAAFRDANGRFPAGQSALIPTVSFDITKDMPDNQLEFAGQLYDLGNFKTSSTGRAVVRLYGDLKQHDMGPGLAESVDEAGNGASMWMTKELWGVGSTAPYLHDGRATTLEEAILAHGGEAEQSQIDFFNMPAEDRQATLAFLKNLVLFFPADELFE